MNNIEAKIVMPFQPVTSYRLPTSLLSQMRHEEEVTGLSRAKLISMALEDFFTSGGTAAHFTRKKEISDEEDQIERNQISTR